MIIFCFPFKDLANINFLQSAKGRDLRIYLLIYQISVDSKNIIREYYKKELLLPTIATVKSGMSKREKLLAFRIAKSTFPLQIKTEFKILSARYKCCIYRGKGNKMC